MKALKVQTEETVSEFQLTFKVIQRARYYQKITEMQSTEAINFSLTELLQDREYTPMFIQRIYKTIAQLQSLKICSQRNFGHLLAKHFGQRLQSDAAEAYMRELLKLKVFFSLFSNLNTVKKWVCRKRYLSEMKLMAHTFHDYIPNFQLQVPINPF